MTHLVAKWRSAARRAIESYPKQPHTPAYQKVILLCFAVLMTLLVVAIVFRC